MRSTTLGLILAGAGVTPVCGGGTLAPDKGDGGGAACDCRIEGTGDSRVLVMSWDCFCAQGNCMSSGPTCTSSQDVVVYPSCGFTVTGMSTIGGPVISVYDGSGALVGKQMGSDAGSFSCPSDATLTAYTVRAGRFPTPMCADAACVCAEGVPICPGSDGGSPG